MLTIIDCQIGNVEIIVMKTCLPKVNVILIRLWRRRISRSFVSLRMTTLLVIFSLLVSQFSFLTPNALAASTTNTWTYNTANASQFTYDSTLVTVDGSGARPIDNVNKLTNTGFESDTASWTYAADTALTTSGNEITDASRTTNTQGDGLTPPRLLLWNMGSNN